MLLGGAVFDKCIEYKSFFRQIEAQLYGVLKYMQALKKYVYSGQ
jgi:hypothetical protein